MSRSGYSFDCEFPLGLWRGIIKSATNGKRGQTMLRELLAAFDAMPKKELIAEELSLDGEVCAIGALMVKRGLDTNQFDTYDYDRIAKAVGVAAPLVQEIEYENDEGCYQPETPAQRFTRMRAWVASQITGDAK